MGMPASVGNGRLAFKGPNFTAWLVAPDGSGLHQIALPDATATITPWSYSPDGTHIAYTGYERGDAGDYAIYVSNADGSDVTDLTSTYLEPARTTRAGRSGRRTAGRLRSGTTATILRRRASI